MKPVSRLRWLCALLVWLGLAALPARANAQSTVINFDDLPDNTSVSNQYERFGLDLNSGIVSNLLPATAANPQAPSAPNVLNISTFSRPEFPQGYVQGIFTNPHHGFVSVRVASFSFGGARDVALVGYDLSNNIVATRNVNVPDGGVFTSVFIFSLNSDIARFEVKADNKTLMIDDLTFDPVTAGPGPDFGLGATKVVLPRSGSGSSSIIVKRFNGSTGAVLLAVSNLPPGVQVSSFVPNPNNGPESVTTTLTLSADASATPVQNWPITLTGLPAPSAGLFGQHSITFPITILDSYDAQVVGIEVTQGIQVYDLPTGSDGGRPLHGVPVKYNGVDLATGGKTMVRVFANYAAFPENSAPPVFDCLLYGFRDGLPLPGSPIAAENNTQPLILGVTFVTDPVRADISNGFRFTLPPAWLDGNVTLKAVVSPSPILGGSNDSTDCCPDNDSFTMTDVPFGRKVDLFFAPFAMRVNRGPLGYPDDVFEEARNLLPIGDRQFHMGDYSGEIDITDIWNQDVKSCGFLGLGSCPEDATGRGASAVVRLKNIADDFGFGSSFELVTGIFPQNDPVSGQSNRIRSVEDPNCAGPFWDCDGLDAIVVQNQLRPRTSVAHELGHMLGRPHAGLNCPNVADPKEPWPPDDRGLIQGVGLDRRTWQLLFVDRHGGPLGAEIFDFMSYCASNSPADGRDSWISVKGWAETLKAVTPVFVGSPTAQTAAAAPDPPKMPVLIVQGFVDADGNGYITKLAPATRTPAVAPATSAFTVVAFDHAGHVLSNTNMTVTEAHIDDAGAAQFVSADIPSANVAMIELRGSNGVPLLRRERSRHAPSVSDVRVTPDVRKGECDRHHGDDDDEEGDHEDGHHRACVVHDERDLLSADAAAEACMTVVSWHAKDDDRDALMAKVDYTMDNGQTWRPLFFGPNHNRAVLNSRLLPSATHARVRVRINDGFNETEVVSHEFQAKGAPPVVRIISPVAGTSLGSKASLYLSGTAADEQHAPITGSNLSWYAGSTLLGTGESISVSGLAPGATEIRLVARDSRGVTASRSVQITIRP